MIIYKVRDRVLDANKHYTQEFTFSSITKAYDYFLRTKQEYIDNEKYKKLYDKEKDLRETKGGFYIDSQGLHICLDILTEVVDERKNWVISDDQIEVALADEEEQKKAKFFWPGQEEGADNGTDLHS